MSVLLQIIGVVLLIMFFFNIFVNPQRALFISLLFIASDYNLSSYINYNILSKSITLISIIAIILKNGINKDKFKNLALLIVFVIVQFISYKVNRSNLYTSIDFITSLANIFLGILMFYIEWNDKNKYIGFRFLAWLTTVSVLCGTIKNGSIIAANGRLSSGTSLFQVPALLGSIGVMSSMILVIKYKRKKYKWIIILNFIYILLTQQRGPLIFAIIILFPYILKTLRKINIQKLLSLTISFPIIILALYYMIQPIIRRTFIEGELNTSGRFEAWKYLWEMSKTKRILGMGIGSLKTATDTFLNSGFHAAHNEYLRFIIEGGYIGLILIMIIIEMIFYYVYKNNILFNTVYIVCLIIAFLILSFVENTITSNIFWVPFSCILSLLKIDNIKISVKKYNNH